MACGPGAGTPKFSTNQGPLRPAAPAVAPRPGLAPDDLAGTGPVPAPAAGPAYLSRTRLPWIFCALNVLRKAGSRRSINSKYDDRAGVCWLEP